MNAIRAGGLQIKSLFLNIFTCRFVYLSPFHVIFLYRTNKQFVFQTKIKIADANTPKTMLTECIASVFPAIRG